MRVLFIALLVWAEAAEAAPDFPWTSFQAIVAEDPVRDLYLCDAKDSRTRITAFLILYPQGFYRLWAMLDGHEWVAIRYDEEARPDLVWRGTWSADNLSVSSVGSYDPVRHLSACDLLFGTRP